MIRRLLGLRRHAVLTPQPTPWTHEKMSSDDVINGLSKNGFAKRRRAIIRQIIGEGDENSISPLSEMHGITRTEHVVIVTSASDVKMSNDVFYPFYQNTNFLYLTGFMEADSVLVIETIPGKPLPQHKAILFVPKYELENEMTNGLRAGSDCAMKLTGVDETHNIDDFPDFIKKYSQMNVRIWGDVLPGRISNMDLHAKFLHDGIIEAAKSGAEIFALTPIIHQNRVVKLEEELNVIQKCSEIACEGLLDTMATSGSSQGESYLSALFEFGCRARGADTVFGCPTVVAGDNRATMPHYDANYLDISNGGLVIISGSPRYSGYCARVGRTWPVGTGKFSTAQAEIYSIVLFIQNGIIEMLNNQPYSLDELYVFMVLSISQKLFELGFFKGMKRDEVLREVRRLSPQFVGHHIGLDLHDTLDMPTSKKLRPGMVINTLPGLYIPEDDRYPEQYHNIGVRIEDTIKITKDGAEVLTNLAPREIDEIEQIFNMDP